MSVFRSAARKVKPGLQITIKLLLLMALRYGPAGLAGWAVKSVARRPLRKVLVLILQPLLSRVLRNISARYQRATSR